MHALWDPGTATWSTGSRPAGVTAHQERVLTHSSARRFEAGQWVLTQACPAEALMAVIGEHLATGARHHLHGYLFRLQHNGGERCWTGTMYLHTCNGWQLSAEGRVRERDMHAAKRRPADLTEFDRRWGMVCDRDGGGCQPRPERIDGMG